jgi:pyrroline-5-carboxylate reductase
MRILLAGCGKMGGALLARWHQNAASPEIYVVEPYDVVVPEGVRKVGIRADVPKSFRPDITVFAVKPQTLPDMITDYPGTSGMFISIAAGRPVSFFQLYLGMDAKIIRAMPNTPAAIGQGITVAYATPSVTEEEKAQAGALLGAVGEVLWVTDEKLLDPVTALSGSGPAYIFLLIETLTQAGIHIGLPPVMAEKLARQTVIGSAALAAESPGTTASVLRQNVTSPGGTTAAALDVLMAGKGLQDLFDRALMAATKRAEELSA